VKPLELQVVSGALTGQTFEVGHTAAVLGRSPDSDLRLHAQDDQQVSSRHAMLLFKDGQWLARDLGSLNGTFVNGLQVANDTPLGDGDIIRLGPEGPELRLVLRPGPSGSTAIEEAPTLPSGLESGTAEPSARGATRSGVPRGWLVSATVISLIAAGGVAFWTYDARSRLEWERERATLLLRIDSVLAGSPSVTCPTHLDSEYGLPHTRGAGFDHGSTKQAA
jgi:hypothetical protein